ncbi:MAG: hypothetical protein ACRDRP_02350 [Pseudonocardiaceae bacterium]
MQADRDDRHPSAPPPRPSRAIAALPSELAALPRPRIIGVSYWLWLGACLVGVLTAAATLRYFGELQAVVSSIAERQFPNETPAAREAAAAAAVAILIGAGVAVLLIQLGFAIAMRSGRGWARFALVPLTLFGVLYSVEVFGTAPVVSRAGLLTTTVLMVIAAVPMFLPGARTWFAQRRRARSGGYTYGG